MASLLVHVLRAPANIHPASAVALCVARDFATRRGATVVALAMGDAGDGDQDVAAKCSRYGADQILFVGPADLGRLQERVAPRRVFAPNTPEGRAFLAGLGVEDADTASLLVGRPVDAEALGESKGLLIHAGTLPWHALEDVVEPDYGEHFADGVPVPWGSASGDGAPASFYMLDDDPVLSTAELESLKVETIAATAIASLERGTLLCSAPGYRGASDAIATRHRAVRLCIIDASEPPLSPPTTAAADFVFAGPTDAVVTALKEPEWREALG